MPHELKKTIKSAPPKASAVEIARYEGICFLAALFLLLFLGWTRSRKGSFGGKGPATEKQLRYLADLVAEQNFFRSKPLSLDEWKQKRKAAGFVSNRFASKLIKSLKQENETLKEDFEIQKRDKKVGQFRENIYVSDLRKFEFCEQAAYYSVLEYPDQNLIDLGYGTQVHRAYSNSEYRDSARAARVTDYIKNEEPDVDRIEWLQNSKETTLRHRTLPLSGRPDGLVVYRDGTKAIIELKTVAKLPMTPWTGDFVQAEIYALLAPTVLRVRDETFVLYTERHTRELALHKRKRVFTEYDLAQVMAKIERAVRSNEELRAADSAAQCTSCGYRSICSVRK